MKKIISVTLSFLKSNYLFIIIIGLFLIQFIINESRHTKIQMQIDGIETQIKEISRDISETSSIDFEFPKESIKEYLKKIENELANIEGKLGLWKIIKPD